MMAIRINVGRLPPGVVVRGFNAGRACGIFMHGKQLPGQHHRKHLFSFCQIELSMTQSLICRLQSLIIRLLVFRDLIRDGFLAWQNRSDFAAKDQIRGGTGGPSIAISERMDPVESPQDVCGQMDRRLVLPVRIDVFAEVLNQLGHLMGSGWLVATPADLNTRWTEISRIRTYPLQRYPMQM